MMVDTIPELRKRVQEPVREFNDVAGLLVGDRVSIHVTRLFLRLGLSPTVGTIGMLLAGLAGSGLLLLSGGWAVLGCALMFVYYVLDCVDGEVARYHGREKLAWGFHDMLFHLYVKSAFFTCLGVHAVAVTGHAWAFLLGVFALLGTLFTKCLYDAALILCARYVILRTPVERANFVRELSAGSTAEELEHDGDLPGEHEPFQLGSVPGSVRAVLTNFDLSILWFGAAAVADLFLLPFVVWGVPCDLKTAVLAFYAVVLPLDFLDRLQTYLRTGGFQRDARRLMRRAHHFRVR